LRKQDETVLSDGSIESVSTIPDECKGVGEGTSTSPKQETPVKEKI
jgi:hypothetical protein